MCFILYYFNYVLLFTKLKKNKKVTSLFSELSLHWYTGDSHAVA